MSNATIDDVVEHLKQSLNPKSGLDVIGQGLYRVVFAVNDALVMKGARSEDGKRRNRNEYKFAQQNPLIMATVFAIWADDLFVIQERAQPLNAADRASTHQFNRLPGSISSYPARRFPARNR